VVQLGAFFIEQEYHCDNCRIKQLCFSFSWDSAENYGLSCWLFLVCLLSVVALYMIYKVTTELTLNYNESYRRTWFQFGHFSQNITVLI